MEVSECVVLAFLFAAPSLPPFFFSRFCCLLRPPTLESDQRVFEFPAE